MKNKVVIVLVVLIVIIAVVGMIVGLNQKQSSDDTQTSNSLADTELEKDVIEDAVIEESESENTMSSNIKVIIDGKTYDAILEDNETAKSFVNTLPAEYNMTELNGNEKYIYLDNQFLTNSYNPKHIEAGDIMLYGNDCLVVFYKSFNTSYSYTKIGHINNLPDLGNKNITIKFEK